MANLLSLLILLGGQLGASVYAGVPSPNQVHDQSQLQMGGRRGLHGMILVGSETYFLEHIPMLSPPHDFQIIVEIELRNIAGQKINRDFSGGTFSMKPAELFSLNDFVSGRLTAFEGSIYDGGFEQGGTVIRGLDRVSVTVKRLLLVRQLPAVNLEKVFEFSDAKNIYSSNIISPANNVQLIKNKTTGKILWCVLGPDFFEPCASINFN